MKHFWFFIIIFFDGIISDTIATYDWNEIKSIDIEIDIDKPALIKNVPLYQWTLLDEDYKHLKYAFRDYGPIGVTTNSVNCSCLNVGKEECYYAASAVPYTSKSIRKGKYGYAWEIMKQYERNYDDKIDKCRVTFEDRKNMDYVLKYYDGYILNNITDEVINSRRVSFKVMEKSREQYGMFNIDDLSLSFMDHVTVSPYFNYFGMKQSGWWAMNEIHLWFGSNNYFTVSHYDESNNIYFMMRGSKSFSLAPLKGIHEDSEHILYPYLYPGSRNTYYYMGRDTLNDTYKVTIKENEILYVPAYWYHETLNDNKAESMAINIWFNTDTPKSRINQYIQRLYSEPLPSGEYVFDDWNEFVYFLNKMSEVMNDNGKGALLQFFEPLYPVLGHIYDDFRRMGLDKLNINYLNMLFDYNNLLKCFRLNPYYDKNSKTFVYKKLVKLLKKKSIFQCYPPRKEKLGRWDQLINAYSNMFDRVRNIDDIVMEHTYVKYIESILLLISHDIGFNMLFISLLNL